MFTLEVFQALSRCSVSQTICVAGKEPPKKCIHVVASVSACVFAMMCHSLSQRLTLANFLPPSNYRFLLCDRDTSQPLHLKPGNFFSSFFSFYCGAVVPLRYFAPPLNRSPFSNKLPCFPQVALDASGKESRAWGHLIPLFKTPLCC